MQQILSKPLQSFDHSDLAELEQVSRWLKLIQSAENLRQSSKFKSWSKLSRHASSNKATPRLLSQSGTHFVSASTSDKFSVGSLSHLCNQIHLKKLHKLPDLASVLGLSAELAKIWFTQTLATLPKN